MRITKQQFLDRFTAEEMAAILAAAKQSPSVEAWLFRFNSVTPDQDGTSIDTKDARTIAGVDALEAAGLLGGGRAVQILADAPGNTIGHARILPPFDSAYPEACAIVAIDGENTITIDAGTSFVAGTYERID